MGHVAVVKPLLIGEAPGRVAGRPLEGRCGERMAALAGVTPEAFYRATERRNVLDEWPGAATDKGARFPRLRASIAAGRLLAHFSPDRLVLLLGYRVARAFGVKLRYFEEASILRARVYVIPHPSGVNVWYNDPANVRRAERFMREVLTDAWR